MLKLPVTTVALIIVCCGSIVGPLGMAAVNIAIPNLAADLNASAKMVGWLPTLYLLSTVMFMLPVGKVADNYGRKRVYAFGLGLNVVAAIMCTLATSIEWLLLWRFVQGAAGAMLFGVGLSIAPAIGGWLTEVWGWRAVFYAQVPPGVLLLLAIKMFLNGEWKSDEKMPFDWWGMGIFSLFAINLVFGLSLFPKLVGILLVLVAVGCLMLFIVHQSKSRRPLIRVQMFLESRVFSLSLATSFFMYASNFAMAFLLSLYLQNIKGLSPSQAGQIILLQAVAMAVTTPLAGKLADKVQPRLIATCGCIIVAIVFWVFSQLTISSSTNYISGALLLLGVGFGLFSTPNSNAVMGSAAKNELGVASSSLNLSRSIGNLFGMSIVNLLVHYYLGESTFAAAGNNDLMKAISVAFSMSLAFVIVASFTSALRGRAR